MTRAAAVTTIAVVVVVAFITALLIRTLVDVGDRNRQKVERMTSMCIETGHTGWSATYGCIGGTR